MKILFKSIIIAVCLLTMSAFGRGPFDRSVSEPEVYNDLKSEYEKKQQEEVEREDIYERYGSPDVLKGLEELGLDAGDFTGEVVDGNIKDGVLIFLESAQYACGYHRRYFKHHQDASLACRHKEDGSKLFARSEPKPCFSCD